MSNKIKLVRYVLLIVIIAGFILYHYILPPRIYSGVDYAGVHWEYNVRTRALKFEATKGCNGEMADCDSGTCDETEETDDLVPWWRFRKHCWWKLIPSCKKIIFGKGIAYIGQQACCDFKWTTKVELSNEVDRVGNAAFMDCERLKDIKFSKRVSVIERNAFSGCDLEKIEFNDNIQVIEEAAFAGTQVETLIIPSSVRKIERYAFGYCTMLKEVKFSSGLRKLGDDIFGDCINLKKIKVPKEKYDEYKEMLYTHGLPETAKVVAY
ncbi:MAG: leucine-rich repeat domain-containing protein [Lachnospiraceae bacterium]|nr:leucine-rich repeat domain-containing protein [Lachnospiraceae bacterium]